MCSAFWITCSEFSGDLARNGVKESRLSPVGSKMDLRGQVLHD
jgi:hypothetical protein